jgi:hypothetical protein
MIHQVTFDEANKEIVDELQKLQLERPQQWISSDSDGLHQMNWSPKDTEPVTAPTTKVMMSQAFKLTDSTMALFSEHGKDLMGFQYTKID